MIKHIYTKFRNGNPLTDIELAVGFDHFAPLATQLENSGEAFYLAAKEARYIATICQSEIESRRQARKAA